MWTNTKSDEKEAEALMLTARTLGTRFTWKGSQLLRSVLSEPTIYLLCSFILIRLFIIHNACLSEYDSFVAILLRQIAWSLTHLS